MQISECPWELANLDCRVAEVHAQYDEHIDERALLELELEHDYVVVKIEAGSMQNQMILSKCDYSLAETQLSIQKAKKDWKWNQDPFANKMMPLLSAERIETEEKFAELMSKISSQMFTTDRIYLDPKFGADYSVRRYKNWIRTEWERGSLVYKHLFRGKYVGFSLCRLVGDELKCLLAGVFEEYQNIGLGFWVPLIPEIIATVPYKSYTTQISSNNIAVYRLYNWQQFQICKFEYVFVKHIEHK